MIRLIGFLLFLVTNYSLVLACCMVPADYEGSISQKTQEAVIFYHEGRQELVLRINYRIAGEVMPNQFAWVITVPNEPDTYALADEKLFAEMFDLSEKLKPAVKPYRSGGAGSFGGGSGEFGDTGVELGKQVKIGPYDIQPVRGVGKNALTGLNRWLEANQFPTEDPEHMKYFVKKDFTFLCIKIAPAEKTKEVKSSGDLPPLHLSFASKLLYYPLRFSSRQGMFDVNLHLVTSSSLNYPRNRRPMNMMRRANDDYKRNYSLTKSKMPDTLKTVLDKSALPSQPKKWFYNYLKCERVNEHDAIAKWKTDIFFKGLPSKPSVRISDRTEDKMSK